MKFLGRPVFFQGLERNTFAAALRNAAVGILNHQNNNNNNNNNNKTLKLGIAPDWNL